MDNYYISFAPLQRYTDAVYRNTHHEHCGGVDEYYTPFVRIEKGEPRRKDVRDINPTICDGTPTVPQIIAASRDEFAQLCDTVQSLGWKRIDINMGCPFPLQVKAGRGCGLISNIDEVERIALEIQKRKEVVFSVKMRLGQNSITEGLDILPILNDLPLLHITLHPRLGTQQYRGEPDYDAFATFIENCGHKVVYNGDITAKEQADRIMKEYPKLKGVMVGRGLLSKPWLLSDNEPLSMIKAMHGDIYEQACKNLCGDSQILSRMHAFWEYIDIDKKIHKAIMKSGSLRRYEEALAMLSTTKGVTTTGKN